MTHEAAAPATEQATTTEAEEDGRQNFSSPPTAWMGLAPEHFQLLRLNPRPTDAAGRHPLRFAQLGQTERHSVQHSLLRLEVRIPGKQNPDRVNSLEIWVDHARREVCPAQDSLQMMPANRGLGRLLLASAAQWLRQHARSYQIRVHTLPRKYVPTPEQARHRDQLLSGQGIEIHYPDPVKPLACYRVADVSLLETGWNQDKVQKIGILEAATLLELADQNLNSLSRQNEACQSQLGQYRQEDGIHRFAIICLIIFSVFQAGLLIWMATH